MATVTSIRPAEGTLVPIGRHSGGALSLHLERLLAGRLLIQGSSGAGKSRTLRRIVEEVFDYTTVILVDPEGEFGNLAEHIGATTLPGTELTADGLTAAANRAREHRLSLHLDLTDLDPEQRILKAAAFFTGLIAVSREHWGNTTLVCIDEAHLLAPYHAGTAHDAETRRIGVSTLTDLCARGRKRGVAPIIATQRLAKLSASVTSELQNFLIGLNVQDRDVARAANLLGFSTKEADRLRVIEPGEFFAMGPALSRSALLAKIDDTITEHLGATPELKAASEIHGADAERPLDLAALREVPQRSRESIAIRGTRVLDTFLLEPIAPVAAAVAAALRTISPNATTASDLSAHLGREREAIDQALDVLAALAIVDTMPRDAGRIARLHARLRARITDMPVVALA